MARKPSPVPESKAVAVLPAVIEADQAATNARAVATLEAAERTRELARELKYEGPTDPLALENSAKDALRRIGMAIYELGAYLLLLKESAGHGKFLPVLERLQISTQSASRYMTVARRFSKLPIVGNLERTGVVKLVELVTLEDEQLVDLAELGQTGELALDDVAQMSLKELRAAVRKERQVKQRLEAVQKELHDEVLQLRLKGKVVAITDWPDALTPITDQVAAAGRKLAQALSELETCRIKLFEQMQALPAAEEPRFEAALRHVASVYQEALERAERDLADERLNFDRTLEAYAPGAGE